MQKKHIYLLPAIIWTMLLAYVLLSPASQVPKYPWLAIPHLDKFIHVVLFFIFSNTLVIALRQYWQGLRVVVLSILIGLLYGSLLEYLQPILAEGRVRDWLDLTANASGTILGVFLFKKKI